MIKTKEEKLSPKEMKQLDEILKRLETLEARIAKLEKAPAAAFPATTGKREVITDRKETNDNVYYKTSEGRVLKSINTYSITSGYYITVATQVLLACGEQDAVDFSDFTPESLREAEHKKTEKYKKLNEQLIALATKYGAKGNMPALLPDGTLLNNYGWLMLTEVSKKAIKF